jgi:hypothetical protein
MDPRGGRKVEAVDYRQYHNTKGGENEKESQDKLGIVRSVLLRGERFVGGIIEGQGGLVRP